MDNLGQRSSADIKANSGNGNGNGNGTVLSDQLGPQSGPTPQPAPLNDGHNDGNKLKLLTMTKVNEFKDCGRPIVKANKCSYVGPQIFNLADITGFILINNKLNLGVIMKNDVPHITLLDMSTNKSFEVKMDFKLDTGYETSVFMSNNTVYCQTKKTNSNMTDKYKLARIWPDYKEIVDLDNVKAELKFHHKRAILEYRQSTKLPKKFWQAYDTYSDQYICNVYDPNFNLLNVVEDHRTTCMCNPGVIVFGKTDKNADGSFKAEAKIDKCSYYDVENDMFIGSGCFLFWHNELAVEHEDNLLSFVGFS